MRTNWNPYHSLIDNRGLLYERVTMESFELLGPIQSGDGFWCDYRILYRQLP